jgi:hypothetical protein
MVFRGPRDVWVPGFAHLSDKFRAFSCLDQNWEKWTFWPPLEEYNALAKSRGVVTGSGRPLHFVEADNRPRGRRRKKAKEGLPYEHRIWHKGEVSTRPETWHDFFNMLAWCLFPKAKAALNQRQAHLLVGARNAEQDLLCMVDEGGVFCIADGDRQGFLLHFGHALHEAIMRGEQGSDGLVIPLSLPQWAGLNPLGLAQVDALVAQLILSQNLARPPRNEPNGGRPSRLMV